MSRKREKTRTKHFIQKRDIFRNQSLYMMTYLKIWIEFISSTLKCLEISLLLISYPKCSDIFGNQSQFSSPTFDIILKKILLDSSTLLENVALTALAPDDFRNLAYINLPKQSDIPYST